jgi:hypothetical protein
MCGKYQIITKSVISHRPHLWNPVEILKTVACLFLIVRKSSNKAGENIQREVP